jgi:5-formyltetrahydrofolate cyclo-ligase
MVDTDRAELRRQLRAERNAIDPRHQAAAAERAAAIVRRSNRFRVSRRIAFYIAGDGEIDTQGLMEYAWSVGKTCYLPVLSHLVGDRLWFAPANPDTPMVINRFGIPEPAVHSRQLLDTRHLDLILMPLVGFDERGNRLGMGGGFYDRSLAFLRTRRIWHRPRLIGLAHESQKVDRLPTQPWDIPLQAVVTDRRMYIFEHGRGISTI